MRLSSLLAGSLLLAGTATFATTADATAVVRRTVQTASIRGELVDRATGQPIPGALVVLVDAGRQRRAAALADARGRFVLPVGTPGRYTLRVERVGYATAVSDPIDVGAGETVPYRMAARVQSLSLEGITVQARARCEVRPGEGSRTQRLWEEVRKALAGTAWAQEQGLFTFAIRRWKRDLDAATLRPENEESRTETLTGSTPFRSAPITELRDLGWVRGDGGQNVYFAPDAVALLADEFLDDHCFRVVAHPTDSTRLGLAFQPVRGRRLPDVEGTLWVDRASAELREMEYRYTGLRGEADDRRAGGRVEFERVPDGAWVVRRWSIRMPQVRETRFTMREGARTSQRLLAFREEGGEITEIRTRSGAVVRAAPVGAVAGVVFDSTRAAPLTDAQVFLSGTTFAAVTDSAGRFLLEGVAPGSYSLSLSHPRLDSLGYLPSPVLAQVEEGDPLQLSLAIPSLASIRMGTCRDSVGDGGVLHGGVRSAGTGVPLPHATVAVSWRAGGQPQRVTAVTDGSGAYRFCSLPAGVPLQLSAEYLSRPLPATTLTLAPGTARQHVFEASTGGRVVAYGRSLPAAAQPVRVSGTVTRQDGSLLPAGTPVRLRLQEAPARSVRPPELRETRLDGRGGFVFGRVEPGLYRLEVEGGEGGTTSQAVAVDGSGPLRLQIGVAGGEVTLDPLQVTAGEVVPRSAGGRNRLTRAQVEARQGSARDLPGLLRRFPIVVVTSDCVGLASSVTNFATRTLESWDGPVEKQVTCHPMAVYLDDAPVADGMGLLRTLPLEQVESVEILTPAEAGARFPDGAQTGVILVYTRGNAPAATP